MKRQKIISELAKVMFAAGATDGELAKRFDTTPSNIRAWRQRNALWREGEDQIPVKKEKWVPQQNSRLDMERVRELYDRGATDRMIADVYGCNINSVKRWRERLKLPEHPEKMTLMQQRISTRRCKKCVHGRTLDDGVCVCLYILDKERRRPCPPGDACTEFTPRKRSTMRGMLF